METFETVWSTIEQRMAEILTLSKTQHSRVDMLTKMSEVHMLFMELKSQNRELVARNAMQKVKAKESGDKLADTMLHLNNLKFESNHFKREILKHHIDIDMSMLGLIPEEEFFKLVGKDIVDKNPHIYNIKRLEFEISHRNEQKENLSELQARQALMTAENNRRNAGFQGMAQKLLDIEKASVSIKRYLGATTANQLSRFLSTPLYSFYSYISQLNAPGIALEIRGLTEKQVIDRYEKYGSLIMLPGVKKDYFQRDALSLRLSLDCVTILKKSVTVNLDIFLFSTSKLCYSTRSCFFFN
jgi:hypothetical protein